MEDTGIFIRKSAAGSGKTRGLIERTHDLLKNTEETGLIALATYTRQAALEINARLIAAGNGDQMKKRLVTGTMHSIATRVMNRYRYGVGLSPLKVHTDGRYSFGLAEIVHQESAKTPNLASELRTAGVRFDEKGLAQRLTCLLDLLPTDCYYSIEELAPYFSNPVLCDFAARSLGRWHREMHNAPYSDYTRIIPEVTELIRLCPNHPDIFAPKDIILDETQDMSPRHIEFIDALARSARSLYAVGCDDQSVYGFRAGGTIPLAELPRHLAMAEHLAHNVHLLPALDYSYRCPDAVAAASVALLGHNVGGMSVPMRGHPGGHVAVGWFNDEADEVEAIAASVSRMPRTAFGKVAILARTHQAAEPFYMQLIAEQVPVKIMRGDDPVSSLVLGRIATWLKISISPSDIDAAKQILRAGIEGLGPATIGKIEKRLMQGGSEAIYRRLLVISAQPGFKKPQVAAIQRLASDLENNSAVLKRDGDLLHWMHWLNDNKREALLPEGVDREEFTRVVDFAFRLGRACQTPNRYIEALSEPTQADHVTIGTFHGSKGREWQQVFVVGATSHLTEQLTERCRDSLFAPGVLDTGVEGERRLFHVALSRASSELILTWSGGAKAASQMIAEAGFDIPETPGVEIPKPNVRQERVDVRVQAAAQLTLF